MSSLGALFILAGICQVATASVNFVVVGDWGGMPIPPYITPGKYSFVYIIILKILIVN